MNVYANVCMYVHTLGRITVSLVKKIKMNGYVQYIIIQVIKNIIIEM